MNNIVINPPEGYKIVEEIKDNKKYISFVTDCKNISEEENLPDTWAKYGSMRNHHYCKINGDISLYDSDGVSSKSLNSNMMVPKKSEILAIIALCKLICLRDKYNNNYKVNWADNSYKYCISLDGCLLMSIHDPQILWFKTEYLRDTFYENFKNLIKNFIINIS